MGSMKTTQYRKERVQTADQMNMACVLKKKPIIHKSRWQARFGPRFPMEAGAEKWSLPGKFILLSDPVLFISNCQHSVSAKEAQELVRQGGPHRAGSWRSFIVEGLNTPNSEHTETTPGFTLQTSPLL